MGLATAAVAAKKVKKVKLTRGQTTGRPPERERETGERKEERERERGTKRVTGSSGTLLV